MADLDLEDFLQTALDAVKGKKTQAKLDDALSRKFSLADLKEAYANASLEERAEFRELFGGTPTQVVADGETKPEPKPEPKKRAKKAEPPEPKQTRPGRRSGSAYDWDVDEGGQVIKLPVARVYNGPNEDEEVEIPEAPTEPESSEDEDAA